MYIPESFFSVLNKFRERLPVHTVMRLFIVAGVWLRFWGGQEVYSSLYFHLWIIVLLVLSIYGIAFAFWVWKFPEYSMTFDDV